MEIPKMIIFDYGQTLVDEAIFDPVKGTEAVLHEAFSNPQKVSAEEVQALAEELIAEIRGNTKDPCNYSHIEAHNHIFERYLYEYFGIEFSRSWEEIEEIFWDAATCGSGKATDNIDKLLAFLEKRGIGTGVISNISFSGDALRRRIDKHLPFHRFRFVIASSEYIFRKPNRRIFELALRKAGLAPHEVWYCGDSPVFDIDGAAGCGIFPVWYRGGAKNKSISKYTPTYECIKVDDWLEVITIIEELSHGIPPGLFYPERRVAQ